MPRSIDMIGATEQLPKARILLYILKFKSEPPKSANKYMYKALLVSDPEGGHFVHRIGQQQTTITAAACSLLKLEEKIGATVDELGGFYNSTSQRNDEYGLTGWNKAEPFPVADVEMSQTWDLPTGNAPISQPNLGDLHDSTSRRNDVLTMTNPIKAVANPNADITMDQSCDNEFAMPTEEEWAALPSYIDPSKLGNLYDSASQRNDVGVVRPTAPENAYVNPSELGNVYDSTNQLNDMSIDGPPYSAAGPNFFDEALAQDGGFPLDFNFNDTDMPEIADQDVNMEDTLRAMDDFLAGNPLTLPDQDMQDPMPALGVDFVTPPTPTLTTPPESSLEPQGLCTWEELIASTGHAATDLFDECEQ